MRRSRPAVLVTGAGGYLGRRLGRRFLDEGDHDVVLAVRSEAGRAALADDLGAMAEQARIVVADLGADDPFNEIDDGLRRRVTRIVHTAAVTRFNVERDVARRTNVDGTGHVVDLARRCPVLERLVHVSTVYATGLREGVIHEEPDDGSAGFANAYEWSKWAAEQVVVDEGASLPWSVLRVATIVADDERGRVTQHNAFHETLKLCFYGLLSLLPGRGDTPLYFVTGDAVTDAVARLTHPACPGGVYHVSPERSGALTLDEVLDLVFTRFQEVEEFRHKRILRPLLADRESFELLVGGVTSFAGSLVHQALANVTPFARQLYVAKALDNLRLRTALPQYRAGDPSALVAATVDQLVQHRWGRRVEVV
ncbi:MAG: SDR family oxidoreductase [Actinobacteria bacterium]|nr:SDR family oxidoreductase [Actinomycetota bacterium]